VMPVGLVDEVAKVFKRYVWLRREEEYLALALWVLHTWAIEAANSTPYVWIYAPEVECGKTRALEVAQHVARNPELIVDPTPAVLFRSLEGGQPYTMLIDEVDRIFKPGDDDSRSALRAILNAGYRRGSTVKRAVRQGADWAMQSFPVFCPKAFDGIRDTLPDTLKSRSIPIPMHRHPRDVKLERFLQRKVAEETTELRDRLAAWADAAVPGLMDAEPFLPPELGDRHAECWEPLFAIADLGGQEFGRRVRKAAVELHRKPLAEEKPEILLLRHVREAFDRRQVDRLSTVQLIEDLLTRDDEDAPWGAWWGTWQSLILMDESSRRGRAKSIGRSLAKLLKPYDIESRRLQIDGKVQVGFERAWFEQAWRSYLP
jgi:Protein of unknown function (DUF3631)